MLTCVAEDVILTEFVVKIVKAMNILVMHWWISRIIIYPKGCAINCTCACL